MKLFKRMFTLTLAILMLMSVAALPAMAVGTECDHCHECAEVNEVQPRYAIGPCYYCGGTTVFYATDRDSDGNLRTIAKCTVCGALCYF